MKHKHEHPPKNVCLYLSCYKRFKELNNCTEKKQTGWEVSREGPGEWLEGWKLPGEERLRAQLIKSAIKVWMQIWNNGKQAWVPIVWESKWFGGQFWQSRQSDLSGEPSLLQATQSQMLFPSLKEDASIHHLFGRVLHLFHWACLFFLLGHADLGPSAYIFLLLGHTELEPSLYTLSQQGLVERRDKPGGNTSPSTDLTPLAKKDSCCVCK